MELTKTFHAPNRAAWRAWLEQHHATENEVWLVYYKAGSGQSSVPYEDSVEEALCFGWIDSLIQKIDEQRYARKFTPRRPGSAWSDSNKRRVAKVIAEGRMTEAGLARVDYPLDTPIPVAAKKELAVPDWLAEGLKISPLASKNFEKLPPSHQRRYIGWISSAKRDETRLKRIREAIALLEGNKRLGIGPDEVRK
jgi:uncharacterized protein YdeI (YjbR/CyaY-like superfamily)